MNATIFTPRPLRVSVERYQRMVATGVLTANDRVELIEGEMLAMAPIGSRHASVTGRLFKRLVLALSDSATVRAANPINLGGFSQPEPDLLVLRPERHDYVQAHPTAQDALLLIEVADTSLAFDQGAKRELYARNGVREYWVVDLNHERLFAYTGPAEGSYRQVMEYARGESVSPQAFPAVVIAVNELFA